MFPNTILTVAMPAPTVVALQATTGPINTIRPKTMVLLPARCWDEYDLSTDQLVIASMSMEICLLSHFTGKTIDQGCAVLARNLAITRGLDVVDTLLLVFCVQEVWNFEWWEHLVVAEEAPAQDWVKEESQQDCFGMSVAQ